MLFYLFHFVISFISTVLFSIIFNAPKRLLLACGFVGALAWTIYQYTVDMVHVAKKEGRNQVMFNPIIKL